MLPLHVFNGRQQSVIQVPVVIVCHCDRRVQQRCHALRGATARRGMLRRGAGRMSECSWWVSGVILGLCGCNERKNHAVSSTKWLSCRTHSLLSSNSKEVRLQHLHAFALCSDLQATTLNPLFDLQTIRQRPLSLRPGVASARPITSAAVAGSHPLLVKAPGTMQTQLQLNCSARMAFRTSMAQRATRMARSSSRIGVQSGARFHVGGCVCCCCCAVGVCGGGCILMLAS